MKMIKHDRELNWGMIILLLLNAYFWVSVYYYGFFVSLIWTIVISSIVGIIFKLKENVWF